MKTFGIVLVALFSVSAMAATGEEIFNSKCTMCHKEGKKGPVFSKMKAHDATGVEKIITRKEPVIKGKDHQKDFSSLGAADLKAVTEYVSEKAGK